MLPQFIEKSHASCGFFRLLVPEARVVVDEERADVRQDERKNARVFRRMWYVATVHKDVLAATMPMKVSENQ